VLLLLQTTVTSALRTWSYDIALRPESYLADCCFVMPTPYQRHPTSRKAEQVLSGRASLPTPPSPYIDVIGNRVLSIRGECNFHHAPTCCFLTEFVLAAPLGGVVGSPQLLGGGGRDNHPPTPSSLFRYMWVGLPSPGVLL
jgi:hypothetical protein